MEKNKASSVIIGVCFFFFSPSPFGKMAVMAVFLCLTLLSRLCHSWRWQLIWGVVSPRHCKVPITKLGYPQIHKLTCCNGYNLFKLVLPPLSYSTRQRRNYSTMRLVPDPGNRTRTINYLTFTTLEHRGSGCLVTSYQDALQSVANCTEAVKSNLFQPLPCFYSSREASLGSSLGKNKQTLKRYQVT